VGVIVFEPGAIVYGSFFFLFDLSFFFVLVHRYLLLFFGTTALFNRPFPAVLGGLTHLAFAGDPRFFFAGGVGPGRCRLTATDSPCYPLQSCCSFSFFFFPLRFFCGYFSLPLSFPPPSFPRNAFPHAYLWIVFFSSAFFFFFFFFPFPPLTAD